MNDMTTSDAFKDARSKIRRAREIYRKAADGELWLNENQTAAYVGKQVFRTKPKGSSR